MENYNSLGQQTVSGELADALQQLAAMAAAGLSVRDASGLYSRHRPSGTATGPLQEQLRLDVDGNHPQMQASGTIINSLTSRTHWIAELTSAGVNTWSGPIWYTHGDTTGFGFSQVSIEVTPLSDRPAPHRATLIFTGGGTTPREVTLAYQSPSFRDVQFEFDRVQGVSATTEIETHAHPNRPAALANETLSIETAFQRAGFNVTRSGGDTVIPQSGAGTNDRWSDMEMHDAMQTYWKHFADAARWSLWTFFAPQHDQGQGLGGIMFDDIGPNHRQGTAIFNDSFISSAPAGDPEPEAWVQRMQFWTACHEMGHAFNLAHSWQKSLGVSWIPLSDEPEVRSFMNYPFNVTGGQTAFFADFEYRFSDSELLFLRHAPEQFVQMGNADWFDNHGFQQANVSPEPRFTLALRPNREQNRFEFLEPIVLELKLTNVSSQHQLADERVLCDVHHMTVIVKKAGRPARQLLPYAQYCFEASPIAIEPGESQYESLFISAGRGAWELAEPGDYTVQMVLHLPDGEDVVSNSLSLRIRPPLDREEEVLAQDFFSDEVGRILTFDGSQVLTNGLNALREVAERFDDRPVAIHARVALGNAVAREYKELEVRKGERRIRVRPADEDAARKELEAALIEPGPTAAESLGHVGYKRCMDCFCDNLADEGERKAAAEFQKEMRTVLLERGVLERVLDEVDDRIKGYKEKRAPRRPKQATR